MKKVRLRADTNLLHVIEDDHADKTPRLIEREGEPLAVVISPEDYGALKRLPLSALHKREILSLAGVWSGLDADRMIEDLYEARHSSPPSAARRQARFLAFRGTKPAYGLRPGRPQIAAEDPCPQVSLAHPRPGDR